MIDGGTGNDTVVYGGTGNVGVNLVNGVSSGAQGTVADSGLGAARDTIEDFVSGIDDIDLRSIDPNAAAGDQAFLFSGTTPKAYSVWYVGTADGIVVRADINGNTTADMEILLKGVNSVTANDFLLQA